MKATGSVARLLNLVSKFSEEKRVSEKQALKIGWIDFKHIKAQARFEAVLDHYGLELEAKMEEVGLEYPARFGHEGVECLFLSNG